MTGKEEARLCCRCIPTPFPRSSFAFASVGVPCRRESLLHHLVLAAPDFSLMTLLPPAHHSVAHPFFCPLLLLSLTWRGERTETSPASASRL